MSKKESKLEWVCPKLLALKEDIINMIQECYDDEILIEIFDILKDE